MLGDLRIRRLGVRVAPGALAKSLVEAVGSVLANAGLGHRLGHGGDPREPFSIRIMAPVERAKALPKGICMR